MATSNIKTCDNNNLEEGGGARAGGWGGCWQQKPAHLSLLPSFTCASAALYVSLYASPVVNLKNAQVILLAYDKEAGFSANSQQPTVCLTDSSKKRGESAT